jgi:hypothetical protein
VIDHVRQGVDESLVDHLLGAPLKPGGWRQLYRDGPHEQVDHFYVDDLPLASPGGLIFFSLCKFNLLTWKNYWRGNKKGALIAKRPFY